MERRKERTMKCGRAKKGKKEKKHIKRSPFVCGYLHSVMPTLPFANYIFLFKKLKNKKH